MSKPRNYKLELITDILKVHPDDLEELMEDLRAYYEMLKPLVDAGIATPIKHLDFTADGKKKYTVKLVDKESL